MNLLRYRCTTCSLIAVLATFWLGSKAMAQSTPTPALPGTGLTSSITGGLFVQEETGAIFLFKADGKLSGWPLTGRWVVTPEGKLDFKAGGEEMSFTVKKATHERLELSNPHEGKEEVTTLVRLNKLEKLNMASLTGYWLIRYLQAADKTANGRPTKLEETGHFRSSEGGYYLRMTTAENGSLVAYSTGQEDRTLPVEIWQSGPHLVVFDVLETPLLLASCYKGQGTAQSTPGDEAKAPKPPEPAPPQK